MKVEQFSEQYHQDYIDFNKEWIMTNFGHLEPEDDKMFSHLDDVIDQGGMIFCVTQDDQLLSGCMAEPLEDGKWELCKLCSNSRVPHTGAGTMAFEAAFEWAKDHGARSILIISNSKLHPALHIYEKFGFKPLENFACPYERGDVAFEWKA